MEQKAKHPLVSPMEQKVKQHLVSPFLRGTEGGSQGGRKGDLKGDGRGISRGTEGGSKWGVRGEFLLSKGFSLKLTQIGTVVPLRLNQ